MNTKKMAAYRRAQKALSLEYTRARDVDTAGGVWSAQDAAGLMILDANVRTLAEALSA